MTNREKAMYLFCEYHQSRRSSKVILIIEYLLAGFRPRDIAKEFDVSTSYVYTIQSNYIDGA